MMGNPITITLKDGQDVHFNNEAGLYAYYQLYAEEGFLEAFWKSPNWRSFEAGCSSEPGCSAPAKELSAISRGTDSGKLKDFTDSLVERRPDRYKIVRGTADAYLSETKREKFWKYNRTFVSRLIDCILWNEENARKFYEFLLVHLQLNQRTLGFDGYCGFLECEKAMLENELHRDEQKMDNGSNMYSDGNGGVYYLSEDGIYRAVYRQNDDFGAAGRISDSNSGRIRSFAMYNGNIRIEIYVDGHLETDDRGIMATWESENKPRIRAAVSYGQLYQLLTEDGKIITNIDRFGDGPEKVVKVGAGLNCLSAIVGSERKLVTTEQTIKIRDSSGNSYTGVRTAGMGAWRNPKRERWFLIDEESNMQYFDDGELQPTETNVMAAAICGRGIYYIKDAELWEYSFDTKETKKIRDLRQEVCNTNEAVRGLFCESVGGATRVFYWMESQEHPKRITC